MSLEDDLTRALWGTVRAAEEKNYYPKIFTRMLNEHGGLETARRLLVTGKPQYGLFELQKRGLLEQSMEAVVLQDRFKSLFSDEELTEARMRLEDMGYFK